MRGREPVYGAPAPLAVFAAVALLAASPAPAPPVETYSATPDPVLVSGDNARLVNALTADPLASSYGVAILYVGPGNTIKQQTLNAITQTHPSELIVVSGTTVVSEEVMRLALGRTLANIGTRLGGADRYDTADVVSDHITDLKNPGALGD